MLSRGEVAIIRAEIERLEKAMEECTDGGIQDQIKIWIEEEKRSCVVNVQNSCGGVARLSAGNQKE
jgi:hypothetical protein